MTDLRSSAEHKLEGVTGYYLTEYDQTAEQGTAPHPAFAVVFLILQLLDVPLASLLVATVDFVFRALAEEFDAICVYLSVGMSPHKVPGGRPRKGDLECSEKVCEPNVKLIPQ